MFKKTILTNYYDDAPMPKCLLILFSKDISKTTTERLFINGYIHARVLEFTMIEVNEKSVCSMPIMRYYDPFNDKHHYFKLNEAVEPFPDKFRHVNGYELFISKPWTVYEDKTRQFYSFFDRAFLQSLSITIKKLNFTWTIRKVKDAEDLWYRMDTTREITLSL